MLFLSAYCFFNQSAVECAKSLTLTDREIVYMNITCKHDQHEDNPPHMT